VWPDMWNGTLRRTAFHPICADLKRSMKSLLVIEPALLAQHRINAYVQALMLEKGIPSFTRKQKFVLGVALALWPVLMLAFIPSDSLISRGSTLCISALLSEAAASVLFFHLRRRRKDRLTFWSTVAAAVAGEVTLAFLIAAVAIAMHA
jgi:hypothetical protein